MLQQYQMVASVTPSDVQVSDERLLALVHEIESQRDLVQTEAFETWPDLEAALLALGLDGKIVEDTDVEASEIGKRGNWGPGYNGRTLDEQMAANICIGDTGGWDTGSNYL